MSGRVREGFREGIPFGIAALLVGVSFGVLAEPVMGATAAIVMSAIVFAGSAQFAALAVLASGGGAVAAIVAGALLNMRFLAMGIALAPSLRGGPLRRAAEGQAVVDASWALANRGEGRFDRDLLVGATLAQYPVLGHRHGDRRARRRTCSTTRARWGSTRSSPPSSSPCCGTTSGTAAPWPWPPRRPRSRSRSSPSRRPACP